MIRYERDANRELWAVAEVTVGTERTRFRVPLGPWEADEPDPGGLLQIPVVVLSGRASIDLVTVAASRAGRVAAREASPEGCQLLTAGTAADILIVSAGNGRTMNVVRALGGRPLPAFPSSERDAILEFLDGCHVDLEVAMPVVDEGQRAKLRSSLAPLRLEDVHHLVEVDPRPGLAAAGIEVGAAGEAAIWAAAAGVLAGRLAAGRRRFLTDRS
jgi:hypothetical protein